MSSQAVDDGSAVAPAPVLGASQQSKSTKKVGRGRELTLPQIRSIIPVYNYYFKPQLVNGRQKRMSKAERESKWQTYKTRMLTEFHRVCGGSLDSERRLFRRHTDPMTYLKYKTGKHANLDPADLNPEQLEYYKEIGGMTDVQDLLRLSLNIDSLEKAAKLPRKRKIHEVVDLSEGNSSGATISIVNLNNHNRNHNGNQVEEVLENENNLDLDILDIQSGPFRPQTFSEEATLSQIPKMEQPGPVDEAINKLNGGLTQYEKELLDKKKNETFELFQEKMKAVEGHTVSMYRNRPEMIGAMMSGGSLMDQMDIAFDFWIKDNLPKIRAHTFSLEDFTEQIATARENDESWRAFMRRWKLTRITQGSDFSMLWTLIMESDALEVEERLPSVNSADL